MIDRPSPPPSSADTYSPHLRTALVLTGTGTAGIYHAGVLRALDEAGVKIDIVAGRGIGVIGALFSAIDGAERLWDDTGFWRDPAIGSFYGWRLAMRVACWALGVSAAIVVVPIGTMAIGLVVFPIDFVLKMVGSLGATDLVAWYVRVVQAAFASGALPTWLPRLVFLALLSAAVVAAASAASRMKGRGRGPWWWRAVPPPLSADAATALCWRLVWDLVRGAADRSRPQPAELGRRYVERLAENLGQPGFRELLVVAHDVDAHRDLVFALVAESRRRDLMRRETIAAAEVRRAEVFDLAGPARGHLADAVAAALAVPVATDLEPISFAPDSYWRGETHRLCDRPAALGRIIDELADLGVDQLIIVSAAPASEGPHALAAPRVDGRARLGEYVHSAEAAVLRDATAIAVRSVPRVFTIRPAHNPIGPFDFGGGYDDRSDRPGRIIELLDLGCQDAYHQFIEPVVGASGERLSGAQEGQPRWRDR
ncbi:MAG: hypothetical protein A3G76_06095 [Acidobacteria bacterium RIFCSPLOWO2_12_FULL_65_11]|nr:MAG: hypothetical protein A3H95_06055 [Acidobacteria bacterium RIFCSPLOWO2_02_FULL_64_15]OFW32465.1 MAG: hypothetical protein A3G76_06095 [Acidobacteria bacterium RIFCSPLOWO2_12_FULL_65_11]